MIRATEQAYVQEITHLTRQSWQRDKIQVDLCFTGKDSHYNLRPRPYIRIFPTIILMNIQNLTQHPGLWLALLYHEAAHHLILSQTYFEGGPIQDLAELEGLQPPRGL